MTDSKYGAGNDGCEWDPSIGDAAHSDSAHCRTVRSTVIVGAHGQWRLCQSCSELPEFKRYRVRKSIEEIRMETEARKNEDKL